MFAELERELLSLTNLETGGPAVTRVVKASDHYERRPMDNLPDLFVEWSGDRPVVRVRTARGDVVEGFYPDYRTGDHREQGAFWITGPGIAARALASPVSIMDFAPTIGELLGVPLPGLDGRPIPGVAGGRWWPAADEGERVKDIRVVGLAKAFGTAPAVDHVDFEVAAGSLVTLLGPSGCGKTTTLRLIAGLEKPDAGEVFVGGRLLTSAARRVFLNPEKRRMGMVFQTYAIWPHMTVFENIAFPLRAKRCPRWRSATASWPSSRPSDSWASRTARRRSSRVGSSSVWRWGARSWGPGRAAPRRALLQSRCPAAGGDALRAEGTASAGRRHDALRHPRSGRGMILSDRVFVMNAGRIAQDGTPKQIYEEPRSRFVMDFLGQVDHVSRAGRAHAGRRLRRRLEGVEGAEVALRSG